MSLGGAETLILFITTHEKMQSAVREDAGIIAPLIRGREFRVLPSSALAFSCLRRNFRKLSFRLRRAVAMHVGGALVLIIFVAAHGVHELTARSVALSCAPITWGLGRAVFVTSAFATGRGFCCSRRFRCCSRSFRCCSRRLSGWSLW